MTEDIIPHEWPTEVSCIVYVDDMLLTNNYRFKIGFDTSSMNPILHDIAFEKVQMFFDILMNNAIIISKVDFEGNDFAFKNNYIQLTDLLNDQSLGSMIFSKLSALVGEDLVIEYVKISSDLGKNIQYTINNNSPELPALLPDKEVWWENKEIKTQPWWCRPDTATYDKILEGDNIYVGEFDWNEHFEEDIKEAETMNTKASRFKIIKGGKDKNDND